MNKRDRVLATAALSAALSFSTQAASAASVADVLSSDPQFSHFVAVVKATGLWGPLTRQTAITVFAPTNEAFDRLAPQWRNMLLPPTGGADTGVGMAMYDRQVLVKSTAVPGSHPESEFRGRTTRVKAVGGQEFVVNGTKSGPLMIDVESDLQHSIGFEQQNTSDVVSAPIKADNGYVYPTNGFTFD
jgi:uncharacterized surface protein with fasciclin (FAS1) repeats